MIFILSLKSEEKILEKKFNLFITILLLLLVNQCENSMSKQVDGLFENYAGENPGASVLVIKDGQKLLSKSYGMANIEEKIPVTEKTNFRLASVTKQFTAMSVMMLVEDGQVHLEDNLKQIFPDFPEYGKEITIRYLLQHNSGLIDYEDLIPDTATQQISDADVLEMMKGVDSTYFTPGSEFCYSNSAYAVLVNVIEKVSGLRFDEFLKQRIFEPLEMNNSVAFIKGKNKIPNRAMGYNIIDDSVAFSDQSLTSAVLGDGGIYSSVMDLYKWDQALYTEKLVKDVTFQQIINPGLKGYGFGWRIDDLEGHYRMSHTGSTCGFRNVLQRYPEDHLTIIILTNRRKPDVENIADEIAKMYLNNL